MSKTTKKRRRSKYRIQPMGYAALALILLIIVLVVVLVVRGVSGGSGDRVAEPTPEITMEPEITPEPTPVPTPVPTPIPTARSATIRSLGEIAIQDNLLASAESDGSYDFSGMFTDISDIIGNADFTIADVEGSLGGTSSASGDTLMRTPPSLIQALKDCGVDMLNLANDHALDGGFNDLQAAIENCNAAGMEYVGAAASKEEHDQPKIIEINGIKVGFLAYTETLNGMESKTDAAAVEYGVNLAKNCSPANDVKALRDAGAEVIVACVSWGEMLKRDATQNQQSMAQVLTQSGVDVILGYNPHVIQRAMWLEVANSSHRTLCILSHGNFLSDSRSQYSDSGVIFQFTIKEKEDLSGFEIIEPHYIPTYVWRIETGESAYDYRVLPAGQYLETAPEDMNYAQESRMRAVWAEAQSIMGSDVAVVAKQ